MTQLATAMASAVPGTLATELLSIPLIVACALVLTPVFVKVLDRHAGWPIVGFFIAALVQVFRVGAHVVDGETITWAKPWAEGILPGNISVEFALRLDPLSLVFSALALIVGSIVFIYSTAYLPKRDGTMSFYLLMTGFMLAVLLLVLADDLAVLFIAWELVSMASFLLIARSGFSGEKGSLRTLLLTFTGGLFLLAALGITVWLTGTTNLASAIASPAWADNPGVTSTVAALVAFGAFTKAAQFPFHAWLPEAMAAATPVSAFLHAAAVVKAGIYVLMRFSTVFADVRIWQLLLIILGMSTAVATAYFALQQTDLKKLIAYSTVSQLGWIVATIGVGTQFALVAATVHTIAHAMFKSSLFMLAGVVDHETGTRDIRRLGSLWRKMPFTFGSMILGAASMAAVPPMFGFISKEGMLEAFTEAPLSNAGVWVLLIVAAIGALGTFAYSARLITGAFIDGDRDMSKVHEAPAALWIPAALPGVASLPVAFFAGSLFDAPLNRVADAVSGGEPGAYHETHLALWHGVTLPLVISIVVILAGIAMIVARRPINKFLTDRKLFPFTGVQAIAFGTNSARSVGRRLGSVAKSYQPSRHLLPLLALLVVYALAITIGRLAGGMQLAPKIDGIDRLLDLVPLVVVIVGVWATVQAKNRLQAAVLLGVTGVGVTLQVLLLGAPDVAMTQFLVEILTVVIMMLVLRHQPRSFVEVKTPRKVGAAVMAIGVGLATFGAVWALTGRRERPEIAQWYLQNTEEVTGEHNIVNVILVEFRAFDTMGELAVLGMAGIAIAAVVASIPRFEHLVDHPQPLPEASLNSIMMKWLVRWLTPLLLIISALVLWRGGASPGGGFNAALIGAGSVMLLYLSKDKDEPVLGVNAPYYFSASGVILAIATGFLGFIKGSFLEPIYGHFLGQHLTSALLFDVGVYFAVIGIISAALNKLGGSDRPGSAKADDEVSEGFATRAGLHVPGLVGVYAEPETNAPASHTATHATADKEA